MQRKKKRAMIGTQGRDYNVIYATNSNCQNSPEISKVTIIPGWDLCSICPGYISEINSNTCFCSGLESLGKTENPEQVTITALGEPTVSISIPNAIRDKDEILQRVKQLHLSHILIPYKICLFYYFQFFPHNLYFDSFPIFLIFYVS